MKMAQKYHKIRGEGGRYKIFSRRGSYHGGTIATLSLEAQERHERMERTHRED